MFRRYRRWVTIGVFNAMLETLAQMRGRYLADFTGVRGWYWQNRRFEP